jgi:hypothetical protein
MPNFKIINASQGSIHKYENIKRKLHNCNANLYFNKQCLKRNLVPSYANIRVPNTSPAHAHTQRKIPTLRIKDEIKYLHTKKQGLNQQLYHLHLDLANSWDNMWNHMQISIDNKLHWETAAKYKRLDKKLESLKRTQIPTPKTNISFHPRIVNISNIKFSKAETNLLEKGLKYNTYGKKDNWIETLALEAETAISLLPATERDTYRKLVANRISTLQRNNPTNKQHPETKLITSIRNKLNKNQAIVTQADKSNTMVIIPKTQHEEKLQDFINSNNFQTCNIDPTQSFQTSTREAVKNSPTLIPKEHRWRYINLNPTAPTIKGLIKLHKQGQPIRPVVNWHNSPALKLAKIFTNKLNQLSPLPNAFNIKNTNNLLTNLANTPLKPHYALASLDIKNLYTNIPVKETKQILTKILVNQNVNSDATQEILLWYDTITKQNYFSHNNTTYIQQEGLAMGAPSSGLIAEIFLQHIEHTQLTYLSHKHKIIDYCRYVDDILIIYDTSHTDIHNILQDFNGLHPNLQFTAETETDYKLNYLDITIHRTPSGLKTAIYRKPTFTDSIIPHNSNHPPTHKFAAVKYLYNRLDKYHLQQDEHQLELQTIQTILHNNNFPIYPYKPKKRTKSTVTSSPEHKWAVFSYIGKETSFITNIFRNSGIKTTFRTTSNVGTLLTQKQQKKDMLTQSGVYKLICPDCSKAYVGQTGRRFTDRYKEHKAAFHHNTNNSSFARHLAEHTHAFGPIDEILKVTHCHNKGSHLNTLERFHIYAEFAKNNCLNDPISNFPNEIFKTITTHKDTPH